MRKYSRCRWLELIEGILLIILGIITLVCPSGVFRGFSIIYGVMAIVTGIADIIFYVKMEKYTGFGPVLALVSGVMSVLAGAMLLMYPNSGQLIIVMLIPIWFIAHSIARLSHLPLIKIGAGKKYYIFSLVLNVIGIIMGTLMIFSPRLAFISASVLIGGYLILLGVDCIIMSGSYWKNNRWV